MESEHLDAEAREVMRELGSGPRLVVIGSTSFWHSDSEATCTALGGLLATIEDVTLVTGGVHGVGEAVGRAFHARRHELRFPDSVVHVLPRDEMAWDYGRTLFAGSDMGERRSILGRVARTYVAVEGGPGTAHEAMVAAAHKAVVIPIGRSGGVAAELFAKVRMPANISVEDWRLLGDVEALVEETAEATFRILSLCLAT